MQYFTICDKKKSWLPNCRINLLLFLNKSRNLISLSLIKLPYKNVLLIQYKDFVPIYPCLIGEGDEIVRDCAGTETKPRLSRNMLLNISKECENGW